MAPCRISYNRESPTCPTTAEPLSNTATVSTHAIPAQSAFSFDAWKISLLAIAMASRMRCSGVPVCRSSRALIRPSAMAAAFSPAACPPTPSTTIKMPRSASRCSASSLLWRTRPGSLAPADLMLGLSIGGALELQVHHAGQPDLRLRRHRRLHVAVALLRVAEIDARRRRLPVDRGPQPAQVLQKKLPVRRIPPQTEMLARNVRQRIQLDVRPVIPPAAPHHDLILRHAERLAPAVVLVLDHRERAVVQHRGCR